jgi:hypothetical protein
LTLSLAIRLAPYAQLEGHWFGIGSSGGTGHFYNFLNCHTERSEVPHHFRAG